MSKAQLKTAAQVATDRTEPEKPLGWTAGPAADYSEAAAVAKDTGEDVAVVQRRLAVERAAVAAAPPELLSEEEKLQQFAAKVAKLKETHFERVEQWNDFVNTLQPLRENRQHALNVLAHVEEQIANLPIRARELSADRYKHLADTVGILSTRGGLQAALPQIRDAVKHHEDALAAHVQTMRDFAKAHNVPAELCP